jgi:hypothetical protein
MSLATNMAELLLDMLSLCQIVGIFEVVFEKRRRKSQDKVVYRAIS